MGFSGSRLVNILKIAVAPIKNMSDDMVNKFINRALLDPEFAYTLISAAKGTDPEVLTRLFAKNMAIFGPIVAKKMIKQKGVEENE